MPRLNHHKTADLLLCLVFIAPAIQLLGQDKPSIAPPDKSDFFEHGENGAKSRVQRREIAGTNFRIAGVDLAADEEVLAQAVRILGKVSTLATGDAGTASEKACYRSENASDLTYLIFDRGEVNPSFILTSDNTVLKPQQVCLRTSKIVRNTATASGLHLGQTPDQVIAILGLPTTRRLIAQARRDEMGYELAGSEKTTPADFARFRKETPDMSLKALHENYDFYDLRVMIHATFINDQLTYLKVDWSATY